MNSDLLFCGFRFFLLFFTHQEAKISSLSRDFDGRTRHREKQDGCFYCRRAQKFCQKKRLRYFFVRWLSHIFKFLRPKLFCSASDFVTRSFDHHHFITFRFRHLLHPDDEREKGPIFQSADSHWTITISFKSLTRFLSFQANVSPDEISTFGPRSRCQIYPLAGHRGSWRLPLQVS